MTVHTYNATLESKTDGLKYHATIFWEKDHPSTLIATISAFQKDGMVAARPLQRWTMPYGVTEQAALVGYIHTRAAECGLRVAGTPTSSWKARH